MQPPAFRRDTIGFQPDIATPAVQGDWMDRAVAFLFSPRGRVSRLAYRLSRLGFYVVYFCLYRIGHQIRVDMHATVANHVTAPATLLYVLAELIVLALAFGIVFGSSVVLSIKRWHDLDKSGLWALIGFVPILGWVAQPLFFAFCRGTVGANRYGPPPR